MQPGPQPRLPVRRAHEVGHAASEGAPGHGRVPGHQLVEGGGAGAQPVGQQVQVEVRVEEGAGREGGPGHGVVRQACLVTRLILTDNSRNSWVRQLEGTMRSHLRQIDGGSRYAGPEVVQLRLVFLHPLHGAEEAAQGGAPQLGLVPDELQQPLTLTLTLTLTLSGTPPGGDS